MRDNVHPGEKWEFNGEVAACFANMLERSIPDYRSMRALTYKLGERFIQPETLIVDVGCSTGLTDGGALIFVEKILSENMDDLMVDLYYEMKRENGYSEEQIMSKRRSLENVLSPLKADWSVDMMRTAGFRQVDMFWRCLNFCGWIAVK